MRIKCRLEDKRASSTPARLHEDDGPFDADAPIEPELHLDLCDPRASSPSTRIGDPLAAPLRETRRRRWCASQRRYRGTLRR
jgi:hypothetical protein